MIELTKLSGNGNGVNQKERSFVERYDPDNTDANKWKLRSREILREDGKLKNY